VVTLYNSFTTTPAPSQSATGACPTPASYWDIGVRGDTGPSNHVVVSGTTLRLGPAFSILTDAGDYTGANNLGSDPKVVSQYCNGSRVPPELGSMGYLVNPGTNETNALPTPVFSLTPSATVDEGNNWINMRWGPLALASPVSGTTLGNYSISAGSPAIDAAGAGFPSTDFFGTARPQGCGPDIGAVELTSTASASASVSPTSLPFGNQVVGTTSASRTLTLRNPGCVRLTGINLAFSSTVFSRPSGGAGGTCGGNLDGGASCTINVVFGPTATGAVNATLTIGGSFAVTGSPVALSGTGVAAPGKPSPGVLDNFNRANATTLGANWSQATLFGAACDQVSTNQAANLGLAFLCSPGSAYWNGAGSPFGARQAAAFTFSNTTLNNSALMLKATGGTNAGGLQANFIRVLYNAGTITIATTTNNGGAYTTAGTLTGFGGFANGNTITAFVDQTGTVYVWKTAGGIDTYLGGATLPNVALWTTGGGRIGMQLPAGGRGDNFAGANVP
jgi:hypothetical protein